MGVRGLWKCLFNSERHVSFQTLRLSESSKKTLVCDLMAVLYWIVESTFAALLAARRRDGAECFKYAAIYGGDFNEYRERLLGLIEALRYVGITPVFFLDGPALGRSNRQMKLATIRTRYEKNLEAIKTYAKICNYDPTTEVKLEKRIKKTLLFRELIQALNEAGVEVIVCTGEADRTMAQYTRENSDKVCGILTNDTDMMLMADCPVIHYKRFDCENRLKLHLPEMERRPREIHCKVLTAKSVARHFKIDERCLPALSILCGNDFTRHLNDAHGIAQNFSPRPIPKPEIVAAFIRKHESKCKSAREFITLEMFHDRRVCEEYQHVVEYSYNFYQSAPHEVDDVHKADHIISEVLIERNLDRFFLSVRSGIVWRNEVEQLDEKLPCIHKTTLPVRELMYRLVCASSVTEYGQDKDKYSEVVVSPDPFEPSVLTNLRALPANKKLLIFFHLFCEQRIIDDIDIPEGFDPSVSTVLTCSSLLFAKRHHLIADPDYIESLLMACVSCALGKVPPMTTSRPGPTGVTIAAQFMAVLQNARYLASLIGFERELPLPSTVFQPYVYIPLHDVVFKMKQKTKFHGEKLTKLKAYYDSLSQVCEITSLKEILLRIEEDNVDYDEDHSSDDDDDYWNDYFGGDSDNDNDDDNKDDDVGNDKVNRLNFTSLVSEFTKCIKRLGSSDKGAICSK